MARGRPLRSLRHAVPARFIASVTATQFSDSGWRDFPFAICSRYGLGRDGSAPGQSNRDSARRRRAVFQTAAPAAIAFRLFRRSTDANPLRVDCRRLQASMARRRGRGRDCGVRECRSRSNSWGTRIRKPSGGFAPPSSEARSAAGVPHHQWGGRARCLAAALITRPTCSSLRRVVKTCRTFCSRRWRPVCRLRRPLAVRCPKSWARGDSFLIRSSPSPLPSRSDGSPTMPIFVAASPPRLMPVPAGFRGNSALDRRFGFWPRFWKRPDGR